MAEHSAWDGEKTVIITCRWDLIIILTSLNHLNTIPDHLIT